MARIVIAVVIIVLILTFGIIDQIYISNSFNGMIERGEQIQRYLENEEYDKALSYTHDCVLWWRKRRDILELTCPHNEVKEFMNSLALLYGNINSENYQDALALSISIQEDALTRLNILSYTAKNVF